MNRLKQTSHLWQNGGNLKVAVQIVNKLYLKRRQNLSYQAKHLNLVCFYEWLKMAGKLKKSAKSLNFSI